MKTTLPLRFKCWHRLQGKVFDVIQIHDGVPSIASTPSNDGSRRVTHVFTVADEPHLVVVQATGYRDVDNKNIFEGDMLVIEEGEFKDRLGVVEMYDGLLVVTLSASEDSEEDTVEAVALHDLLANGSVKVAGSALEWMEDAESMPDEDFVE